MSSLPHIYSPISISNSGYGINLSTGNYSGFSGQPNPHPPLTLNQISAMSVSTGSSPFNITPTPNYKKYEIYELTEDALVLSCVWHRLKEENKNFTIMMITSLISDALFDKITHEDINLANKIRDHFSKKLMMLKLKGIKFSNFREQMNTFIHGDVYKVREDMFSLICKLPEMYDYDLKFTLIQQVANCNTKIEPDINSSKYLSTFTPLGQLSLDGKNEYWFKDESLNVLAMIQLEQNNELLHFWDTYIEKVEHIEIYSTRFIKQLDEIEYLSIKDWSVTSL